jgi:hypothetical protein
MEAGVHGRKRRKVEMRCDFHVAGAVAIEQARFLERDGACELGGGRDKRTVTTYLSKPISPAPRLSRINLINNPPEIFLEVYQVFSEDRMKS